MNTREEFIDIPLDRRHIHLYVIRTAIHNALRDDLHLMTGTLLDVGCGHSPYKELFISEHSQVKQYVGIDLEDQRSYKNVPDLTWDGNKLPVNDCSAGTVIATEVLEHSPRPVELLREMHRVLEKSGRIFITVPFFWMLHEVPYDEYRYTPFSLERMLKESGFSEIRIRALGGWNASLVQMFANWVYYSDERQSIRRLALRLLWPFIKQLIRRDRIPSEFMTGQMFTGLYCVAQKQ